MRASGILMHISSLPSPWGIGTFGKAAYDFVDFLHRTGQQYWQILPVGPTSYGDSPYQSFSTFAGNPYFIDLDFLREDGLLEPGEYKGLPWSRSNAYVDYGTLYQLRYPVLRKAALRGLKRDAEEVAAFREENTAWVEDYALFMALKGANDGKSWQEWGKPLRHREPEALTECRKTYADEIDFWVYLQFLFFRQWKKLKEYAKKQGVSLVGDLPIYVALDSADVWASPSLFALDEDLVPKEVAGVPPDYFSADGQLWGNPLYDWEAHKKENYAWWISRVQAARELYDFIRIDHFRGFASYCAIPYGDKNARRGKWVPGPGMELFQALKKALGPLPIIAEDLGVLTEDVTDLLQESGYPGMKVLQFAFDSGWDNAYLPHNHVENSIVYTGTHDNDTVMHWWHHTLTKKQRKETAEYLRLTNREGIHWGMVRAAWGSVAKLAVAPIQDILGLDGQARMNTPSTLGNNWRFRITAEQLTPAVEKRLLQMTRMYGRYAIKKPNKAIIL
ncbi:MAG: 4-alpha-glucanotransferase [Oscillospiraceae bacterium]|nr:4-alpha-glucanotransferase [Oscillospiraceae bacterium]